MRKKKTTTATETVKTTSAAAKTAVKAEKAAEKPSAAPAKEEAVKETVIEETPAKETAAEATKETAITDTTLEIFETRVSMASLNNAIMADAKANGFCGEIKAYINAAERAVYYTVDNDPEKGNKIELSDIA